MTRKYAIEDLKQKITEFIIQFLESKRPNQTTC
jgi:hypothetical protein